MPTSPSNAVPVNFQDGQVLTAAQLNTVEAAKVDGVGGAASGLTLVGAAIDATTSIASALPHGTARSLSARLADTACVLDFGVVPDPAGNMIAANTAAYLTALANCAGRCRLVHPAGLSIVVSPIVTGPLSAVCWQMDGTITLAPGANASLVDISGWTHFLVEGCGIFNGNAAAQPGGYPHALGGFVSNVAGTQDTTTVQNSAGASITVPPMPVYAPNPLPVSDGILRGITLTNFFNWPVSLGGLTRVTLEHVTMSHSGSSPQFFQSAQDCNVVGCHIFNITDGGFVFYRGNARCTATGNNVHDCHDGIGVYAEYDTLPADTGVRIAGNTIWNNADSGIGITTGGTPPALMQTMILVEGNTLYNNNTGGRNGGGSIGIVGAQAVSVRNNLIYGDGAGAQSSQPAYSIFVDGTSRDIVIDSNTIGNCGTPGAGGVCIWLAGTSNACVTNNVFFDTNGASGVTKAGVGGSFGTAGIYENNRLIGAINGFADEIAKPADLQMMQRTGASGTLALSNGLTILGGVLNVGAGTIATSNLYGIAAGGTSQSSATPLSAQTTIITSASGNTPGVRLPGGGNAGVIYTLANRSGAAIAVYPPASGQIEGFSANAAAQLPNGATLQLIWVLANSNTPGGTWFGWQASAPSAAS